MTEQVRKRGRPRDGQRVKTAPISVRTDPALRERIEALQAREGLSFTQAVERVIRRGLDAEAA